VLLPIAPALSQMQVNIAYVSIYPNQPTVRDQQVYIVANISSPVNLESVTLYIGPSHGLTFPQNINYTAYPMYQSDTVIPNREGLWTATLPQQPTPVDLAFYVQATGVNNESVVYPSLSHPEPLVVLPVPETVVTGYSFQINAITLAQDYSYANITIQMSGVFPYSDAGVNFPVFLRSIPHGYGIFPDLNLIESTSDRFDYYGSGSFTTELSGNPSNYPYDSYILGVNMTLPYANLSVSNSTIPLYASQQFANAFQDAWSATEVPGYPAVSHPGNDTTILVEFQLHRLDQSSSLPLDMISIASVILLASAMIFPVSKIDRRLTVYLTSVVISVSVLLTPSLNPLGFGITLYQKYYSYLMLSTALLVVSSVFAWRIKRRKPHSAIPDVAAGALIVCLGVGFFYDTPMPAWIWLLPSLVLVFAAAFRYNERFRVPSSR
jgi:hypothetical protein